VTEPQEPGFSFEDRRRIDPDTYEVREQPPAAPAPGAVPPAGPESDDAAFAGIVEGLVVEEELADVDSKIAELTSDLQRVHAEYANYRKRVDRDRETNRDAAIGGSLAELLPVLDDIGRAREHGDLEGAFKAVAEAVEAAVARQGLERFGSAGDEFDPTVHQAITHTHSPDVTVTTCVSVFQPGYRFKGKILRPAVVAVADPE
jgi:molecular chaperone GrpE